MIKELTKDRLSGLSKKLDICVPLLAGSFLLLDYPVHGNIGDLLIWHGEKEFFRRNKKKPLGQYSINNIGSRALKLLNECSTICFHGGGNFGDLWPWYQQKREEIIQHYPQKRIVVLPQTVYFSSPRELDRACAVMKAHPDLHIFCRDSNSLSILDSRGVPNIHMCPDMAHALWGVLATSNPSQATQSAPLYLLRRDKEAGILSQDASDRLKASFDWDDLLVPWVNRLYRIGEKIDRRDGRSWSNNRLPAHAVWYFISKILIRRAVGLFSNYETIVTNRLHGMILAILLKRKAIVLDNSYGKIASYVDLWMNNIPDIELLHRHDHDKV
jgi:pyruvyl transferase EpsO